MVMRWLKAYVLCVIFFAAPHAFSAVSAQLSAQNIDELESVFLRIKVTETRQSQPLDLTALADDFDILNTNTVSQSRYLNGRGQNWVDYQITLQPKKTGTLTIPAITIGQETTPSLLLNVRPLSPETRKTIESLVFYENELSSDEVYVQGQVVLTRRLLYTQGVQLFSDLPEAPEVANAVVLTLGETRSSRTQRNGRNYGTFEQQYAIFPERSGTLTIPGVSITTSVRIFEGNRASRKGVRVNTEDIMLSVLPVPDEYPKDRPWLPAEEVTLHPALSPAGERHQVGDTLTHELLIYIQGNIGTLPPPVELTLDDSLFRVYPQAPTIEDDTSTSTVRGSRLETHTLVPLVPGTLTLPSNELVWWDTVNRKVRVNRTEPRTLIIAGTQMSPETPATQLEGNSLTPETSASATPAPSIHVRSFTPYLLAAGLIVAGILAFRFVPNRFNPLRRSGTQHADANQQKSLTQAFANQNIADIHHYLGGYLSQYYGLTRPAAFQRFRDEHADNDRALGQVEAYLYAKEAPAKDGNLVAAIAHLDISRKSLRNRPTHKPNDILPALY